MRGEAFPCLGTTHILRALHYKCQRAFTSSSALLLGQAKRTKNRSVMVSPFRRDLNWNILERQLDYTL
jgi:hypothetical protein